MPDMTLAEAVRLSSNFPFAFRPIDLRTASGLLTTTLDGGISDNTGVDSVFYLLAAIRELVEKGDEGAPRDFLTHLRKHGLIVLEISSDPEPPDGHRPSPSSGNHLDALGTLIGSLFANANRAATFHRVGIEEVVTGHFDKTEDDKLLSSVPLVLWHTFRLKADQLHQFENVPTTWSLGPVGKRCVSKMVLKDLKERWAPRSANLRNELTFLCAVEKQALRVGRLPLLLKRSGVLAEEIGRNIAQQSEGARNLQELLHRFRWVDSAKSEMASRLAAEATKYVEQKRKLTERERVSLETVAALSRDNLEKGIERWRKLYRTGAASD